MLGVMALAEGTPVIVAESGGTAAGSGVGCLPVPPGDKRSMMAAMRRLASDPAEAGRLGEQGRAAVMHRFARAPIKTRLLQLYRTVARTRRSAVALL